jgi:hypothetical protein
MKQGNGETKKDERGEKSEEQEVRQQNSFYEPQIILPITLVETLHTTPLLVRFSIIAAI